MAGPTAAGENAHGVRSGNNGRPAKINLKAIRSLQTVDQASKKQPQQEPFGPEDPAPQLPPRHAQRDRQRMVENT
ncbi:hypothetical protein LTR78_003138 [Recurvomyces mirabilis]|uniref:Uncharacterized protein n=1 Tax=Recurvomyces mirabilis TaxID=574656 RepID=A0AAE0WSB5_9PEZI|nr:hypothetical protein LTR78_003138 [Recurvomyces mirabilis]KAK5157041.1 hypothetical protein LTS14_004558 [Recurvomyces mirabilis]